MKRILLSILLATIIPVSALAEDGYVHGDNHCFYFSAPSGWVADHISGRNQDLPFVFYPAQSSWADSTSVIYARVEDRSNNLQTPQDKVAKTLREFQESGSPDSRAEKVAAIKSHSGSNGEIYKYTGDRFGNTELVAYFIGKDTINFFVMTSRDEKDLESSRVALEEIAKSYREANDCISCEDQYQTKACGGKLEKYNLPSTLAEAITLGEQHEKGELTRNYHNNTLIPYFGNKYSSVFRYCFETTSKSDDRPFNFVAAIGSDGNVIKVYRDLETNIFQCMNKELHGEQFPRPPIAPYFMYIDMKFTP